MRFFEENHELHTAPKGLGDPPLQDPEPASSRTGRGAFFERNIMKELILEAVDAFRQIAYCDHLNSGHRVRAATLADKLEKIVSEMDRARETYPDV